MRTAQNTVLDQFAREGPLNPMPPGTPESARKIAAVAIPERPRTPEFRPSGYFRFHFVLPIILCDDVRLISISRVPTLRAKWPLTASDLDV